MAVGYNPSIVSDGLVLYLDAANRRSYVGSGVTANGLVGGINGSLVNGTGFTSSNNGCFVFDGSNDYINVPSITSISGDFSVLIWFKTATTNPIFTRLLDFDYINGFWLGNSSSATSWGGGIRESGAPYGIFLPFTDNEWHFLVSVRSNTTHYIYRDGIANFTSNTVSSNSLSNSTLVIGSTGSGVNLNGNIGQVQIYNRALTQQEILQNFNATRFRYGI
jgi:hypothetical protein